MSSKLWELGWPKPIIGSPSKGRTAETQAGRTEALQGGGGVRVFRAEHQPEEAERPHQEVDHEGRRLARTPTPRHMPVACWRAAAAPTAAQGTNTTQLATTQFVNAEIAADLTAAIGNTVQAHDADTAKTDVAQNFTAAQRAAITALTFAAEMTPDFNDSNNFSVTLTGTGRIKNPTNQVAGQSGSIFITQDGTGSRVLSWGDSGGTSAWYWAGGTAPTLSTGANVKDRVDYIVAASGVIHAVATLAVSANTP